MDERVGFQASSKKVWGIWDHPGRRIVIRLFETLLRIGIILRRELKLF